MPATWVSLLPSEQAARENEPVYEGFSQLRGTSLESFMTEGEKTVTGNVLMGVGLMVLAFVIALMFGWSYSVSMSLFVAVIGLVMFIFSLNMLIYISIIRSKMSIKAFNYYFGLTLFMAFMTLFISVFFTVLYVRQK